MPAHVGAVGVVIAIARFARIRRQRHLEGVGMLPVEQRVVEARPKALGPHRIGELPRDVATRRGDVGASGDRIVERVGLVRVEEREAVVVLRGHDRVAHARVGGERRPFLREAVVRLEYRLHLPGVLAAGHRGPVLDPLRVVLRVDLSVPSSAGARIETPVDEHAKPRLAPPRHALVAIGRPAGELVGLGHAGVGALVERGARLADLGRGEKLRSAGRHGHRGET